MTENNRSQESLPRGSRQRIVILGGGFAGVYAAQALEALSRKRDDLELILVSRENYLVFQPMLPEVISGDIGPFDTVCPIRRLLPRTMLYVRDVQKVDFTSQTVTLSPGYGRRPLELKYDHLILGLGNVTDFRSNPGLRDHALPFKYLADALRLRDHLIHVLGEAEIETDPDLRRQLLTFVVGGGGFSGTEVAAQINDFVRDVAHTYRRLTPAEIRVILIHSHERILHREMPESLALYAQRVLQKHGVELFLNRRLSTATPECAVLDDGTRIPTRTIVSTVPSSPNPLLEDFDLKIERGRIVADLTLQADGQTCVWAMGDCAAIPNPSGKGICPPTAQFAIRQAETCAHNVVAAIDGRPLKSLTFTELGKMASLGKHRAIVQLFGKINLQGVIAWWFWRAVYWSKLPGLDRKIKVGASWLLDILLPPELVQTKLDTNQGVVNEHYEPPETVVVYGDETDRLILIVNGEAELVRDDGANGQECVAVFKAGEFFSNLTRLGPEFASTRVRAKTPLDVSTFPLRALEPWIRNDPQFRERFENGIRMKVAHAAGQPAQ